MLGSEKMTKNEEKTFVDNAKDTVTKIMDTNDSTKNFTKKDIEDNKGMAVLSYILAPIPYFASKKSKWVKYHAVQGMNLFFVAIIYGILSLILTSVIKVTKTCEIWGISYECGKITPWWVIWPLNIIGILILVIAVIGILNVINGKAKELPIINKIKIVKN